MTTKQLVAKIKKLYKEHGEVKFNSGDMLCLYTEKNKQTLENMIPIDRLCIDDNVLGVMCVGENWFIPLTELTYKELMNIVKMYPK